MKLFLFFFLLPLFSMAQTIHYKKDSIVYTGSVTLTGVSKEAIADRLPGAVQTAAEESKGKLDVLATGSKLTAAGKVGLNSPFHIIRTLHFTLQVGAQKNGYNYQIHQVSVTEKRRGGKEEVKSSKELLEGTEDTGNVAIATEILLNEIDMRLQKLLAVLEKELKKPKSETTAGL